MSINDEINLNEEKKVENNKPKNKKINKKKVYLSILGCFLAILFIISALTVYSALTYVVGCFTDYSMAPTINKKIKNKDGKTYNYSNFVNSNGNIVEYGFIEPVKTKPNFKRFEVVAIKKYEIGYLFDAYRVVGLPGETVKLDYEGDLYVNGEKVVQPIDKEYLKLDWTKYEHLSPEILYFEETLGENEYYLLNDNRYYFKNDSRTYGAFKYEEIYGTVVAIMGTCAVDGTNFIHCSFPFPRFI